MYAKTLSVLALAGVAQSHMSMFYPPPLGGAPSINKQSTGKVDSQFNYPLGCCGEDGPTEPSPGLCRGHLDKFDTEEASVTWTAGQDAYFQLTDYSYDPNAPGSTHSGGSCQVGFSLDKGKTWKAAASYHGACPHATEDGSPEAQTFDFKVPTGMPSGDAIFAWIWLNREHEAFMNCAKVNIASSGSSNDSSPSQPSLPSTPSQPITPQEPEDEPSVPQQPEDEEEPALPSPPKPTGRPGPPQDGPVVTITKTIETTEFGSAPTQFPSDDSESDDSEDSEDSDDNEWGWWRHRPHRKVQDGARRYKIEGNSCECRRDERTLAARCSCDAPHEKRSDIERMALRKHRRTFYKRVDACSWDSAPAMEVSYYTSDAKCAPNAKLNMPESDNFELKWDVPCGAVEGESEYPLKTMSCSMYGA